MCRFHISTLVVKCIPYGFKHKTALVKTHALSTVWCGWCSRRCCRWWWGPVGPRRREGSSGRIWCERAARPSLALYLWGLSASTAGSACSRFVEVSTQTRTSRLEWGTAFAYVAQVSNKCDHQETFEGTNKGVSTVTHSPRVSSLNALCPPHCPANFLCHSILMCLY